MIEPYVFVRAVTIGLGLIWTGLAGVRVVREARRWRLRLEPLAVDDRRWRSWIVQGCLRVTVLDPLNLALVLLLLALWTWKGPT